MRAERGRAASSRVPERSPHPPAPHGRRMSSGALFPSLVPGSRGSSSKYLVEFRAGKMALKGSTVTPDKRKGLVYIQQTDDSLIHFCWKDRASGTVEDVSGAPRGGLGPRHRAGSSQEGIRGQRGSPRAGGAAGLWDGREEGRGLGEAGSDIPVTPAPPSRRLFQDLIIFPDDCEFKRVPQCTTGRVYVLKFKAGSKRLFFWMQVCGK